MADMDRTPLRPGLAPPAYGRDAAGSGSGPANLADILECVLDKGIVIAGDIQINLLDIELITIKIRLLVASVERAKEMGINWWEADPTLSVEPREERVEFRALGGADNINIGNQASLQSGQDISFTGSGGIGAAGNK